jgi:thiaminase (transcriptional activator TenA)
LILGFSDDLWHASANLRAAIHVHPFNQELAAGTLPRVIFAHYMVQDSLYLRGYARVLSLAAAKAQRTEDILECAKAAEVAIIVERALHAGYLDQFGISQEEVENAEATPACEAYVNFMLATAATDTFGVLVSAILPCFWLYHDVGTQISKNAVVDNFYQAWIDTYGDESFAAATLRMRAIVDVAGAAAGPGEQARMTSAFLRCAQYEWLFWESAYSQAGWPIIP